MNLKRVTIFSGNYGSGKTNVAVNFASFLSKLGKQTAIYDLDIVNPYFRTVDAIKFLEKSNVELVVSPYAETNVDIPAMNAKSYQMTDDKSKYAIVDLGGDDRGALAMGRFSQRLIEENDYDFLMVVNCFRPETRTIENALIIKDEIERTAKIKFTGIVNNSNLGVETNIDNIKKGIEFSKKLSIKTNLPIYFNSVRKDFLDNNCIENAFGLELIKYGNW